MLDLTGRRGLIMGVANGYSIAWALAQSLAAAGAKLAFSYLPDTTGRAARRVQKLAETVGSNEVWPCDVRNDAEVSALFDRVRQQWGGLEILVHSLAWAQLEDLKGEFSAVSRTGFLLANEISTYSLVAAAHQARTLLTPGKGAIITLSYIGSQRAVPNYNIMGVAKAGLESAMRYLAAEFGPQGIRVNAISAGPIETLSASGIQGFDRMLKTAAEQSPLRRNVSSKEVGDAGAFLCSDLAQGITGQVLYVDAGYHISASV